MDENTQMLELMNKIEKTNRRQLLFTQILCGIALVAAVFCIIVLLQVLHVLPQLEAVVLQMQTVLNNMEEVSAELAQLDMQSIVGNVDGLVNDVEGLVSIVGELATSAQDSLKETMSKLDSINFDALNKAIEDLADVVEPLAKFFNVFN